MKGGEAYRHSSSVLRQCNVLWPRAIQVIETNNFVLQPSISLQLSGNNNLIKNNIAGFIIVGPITLASQLHCPSTGMHGFGRQLLAQRGPSNSSPVLEYRKFANTVPPQAC